MKWLDFKKRWLRSKSSSQEQKQYLTYNGVATPFVSAYDTSTVNSPEQALRLDTVYRCADILSGTIASLPLQHLRLKDEVFCLVEDSSLNYLFSRKANPRQNFFVLMQNAILSVLFHGNAYILPIRGASGLDYEEIYLLSPYSVSYDVIRNKYNVQDANNGFYREFDADEIIHIKNKTLDGGYLGVSTIYYATRTLDISAQADRQTLDELRRGNRTKGFISGGNPLSGIGASQDDAVDAVAKRIEQEIDEDKSIMRLPGSITYTPLSISPQDAQLLETRKFSPYSICRFFGVHPDMVFVEQSSNYKASENSQITFLNQTLAPLLAQIQTEFTVKLIKGSIKTRMKQKIEFSIVPLYVTDIKSRGEYFKSLIESGVMTPNEARRMENRAPVEGGDVTFISCNVAPINSAKIRGEKPSELEGEKNTI